MAESALAGVKVLEYCQMVAGPYCTKLMADLGAEVVKMEKPGWGDEGRKRSPFLHDIPDPETSGLFLYLNTNKLGITLNVNRMDVIVRYANERKLLTRAQQGVPYGGILPCKDNDYTVFVTWQERQWERVVSMMGSPDWVEDEKFKDSGARFKHGELLNAFLVEWLVNYTKEELYHMGQAKGVPFGMVNTSKDLLDSEHLKERGFFVEIDHPRTGKIKYPSAPYKFSLTPWRVNRPAPLLGEHNDEIYCGRLGYSKGELVKLREARVI